MMLLVFEDNLYTDHTYVHAYSCMNDVISVVSLYLINYLMTFPITVSRSWSMLAFSS